MARKAHKKALIVEERRSPGPLRTAINSAPALPNYAVGLWGMHLFYL